MFFLMWHYLLEAALTAAIFFGGTGVVYLFIQALRMAYEAIHHPSEH